jgi:hypothetical protein
MVAVAAFGILNAAGASASTVMVVNGKCVSVTDPHGCLFNGNINANTSGSSSYLLAQDAYNLYNNTHPSAAPDITLTAIADTATPGGPASITGAGGTSGTWSLDGYLADFIAVKAGSYFDLYELSAPASSGTWSTFDLLVGSGSYPALSRIVFFGSQVNDQDNFHTDSFINAGVPEPATWAMMLAGFGLIGTFLRSRRIDTVTA